MKLQDKAAFTMRYLQSIFLLCFLSVSVFAAKEENGKAKAFDCHDNIVCVSHGDYVDFIDWKVIDKPVKRSRFFFKDKDDPALRIDDVAMNGDHAYLAINDEGICTLDISNLYHPKQVHFATYRDKPASYHHNRLNSVYGVQSIKIQSGLMIVASFLENRSKQLKFYDISSQPTPQEIVMKQDSHGEYPKLAYPEWDMIDQFVNAHSPFVELNDQFPGYLADVDDREHGKEKLIVKIFNQLNGHATTLEADLKSVRFKDAAELRTRAHGKTAAISLGNGLWIVDLEREKIVFEKIYDESVAVAALNDDGVLAAFADSSHYFFLNSKNNYAESEWDCEFARDFILGDRYLILKSAYDESVKCYDISDVTSISQVAMPDAALSSHMKWIFHAEDLIIGHRRPEGKDAGTVTITGMKNFPSFTMGELKGVDVGPKGVKVQGNRLYLLDAGNSYIREENWQTYEGKLKAVDLTNIEEPTVKGVYDFR